MVSEFRPPEDYRKCPKCPYFSFKAGGCVS